MDYVNFIKEYGSLIFSALVILLDVIILLVKRRPKTLDDFLYCLKSAVELLPGFIIQVEKPGEGASKKSDVIQYAMAIIEKDLGRNLSDSEYQFAYGQLSNQIEFILSTPTKKGGSL